MTLSKFFASYINSSALHPSHIFHQRNALRIPCSPPPPPPPSILRKPTLAGFTLYNSRPYYSTSHPTTQNPISKEFCSWVLSICNSKSIKRGVFVHSPIIKLGLQDDLYLVNNLLTLYSKCYSLKHARNLFEEICDRDVVSWTSIISAYTKAGEHEEALSLFDQMLGSGLSPNEFTFSTVVRSCSYLEMLERGVRVHAQIVKLGFESNPVLASALVDFYSKCGSILEACEIFNTISNGDTVSWTTMISSFVQTEEWDRGVRLYLKMIEAGIVPNEFTFVKVFTACSFLGLEYGKLIHAHLIVLGIELNLILKTALVDMYSKCQMIKDALKVSNQTSETDVMLWTVIISGYTQVSDFEAAISALSEMKLAGISPNSFTYAGILSSINRIELGRQFHSQVIKDGVEWDVSVGNGLVDMYMKCSPIVEDALQAFREILSPNVISWTSLVDGFAQHGMNHEAYQAFVQMRAADVQPNSITMTCILNGCAMKESPSQARKLHTYIIKTKAYFDITVGNTLVNVYARMGMLEDAWNIMNIMACKDAVTYTSLATSLNQMSHYGMTLDLIAHMHGVKMDDFSVASFLSASAGLAAMEPGKQLHCHSFKSGLCNWLSVSNGLVDMYGKCGSEQDAERVFLEILKPNVVSWNGLISALASNGYFSSAFSGFEDMILAGIQPDEITFLLVLYACSHGGLVDKGIEHFYSMNDTYNVVPQLDHYVCLVDLLGRAGRLEEAIGVIEKMPFLPDALVYKTILGSCKVHRNLVLGEDMARRALELDPRDPAVYVLLANLYDDVGRSDFGDMTRKMMREKGLRKNPGQSWMELRNKVHVFTAGDGSHPQIVEILEKLESLKVGLKSLGYEFKGNDVAYHSEKLAIAFSLLTTPSTAPIRIIKNLRICSDCHTFTRLVSQLVSREIVVRDGNRFHSFKKAFAMNKRKMHENFISLCAMTSLNAGEEAKQAPEIRFSVAVDVFHDKTDTAIHLRVLLVDEMMGMIIISEGLVSSSSQNLISLIDSHQNFEVVGLIPNPKRAVRAIDMLNHLLQCDKDETDDDSLG